MRRERWNLYTGKSFSFLYGLEGIAYRKIGRRIGAVVYILASKKKN